MAPGGAAVAFVLLLACHSRGVGREGRPASRRVRGARHRGRSRLAAQPHRGGVGQPDRFGRHHADHARTPCCRWCAPVMSEIARGAAINLVTRLLAMALALTLTWITA